MIRFGAFAIVVCSVGCAKIEAEFEDPGTPVRAVENGFGRTVEGPGYTMVFHGGGELDVHMPESLRIAGSETLAIEDPTGRLERQIGFGLFPALIATSDTLGTVVASDITTNDDGPFVAQISTTFTIEYTCNAPVGTRQFKATSVFTFFPNGRINRFDTNVQGVADGDSLSGVIGTACPPATEVFPAERIILTSFWAFAVAGVTSLVDNGVDVVVSGNATEEVPGACTVLNSHSIGLQYDGGTSRLVPNPNAEAHVFDFIPRGTTTLTDTRFEVISQVQLRGEQRPCSEVLGQLARPAISVGGQSVPTQNQDGIYQDPFNPRDEAYDVEVIGSTAVPAGWVLATEPSSDTIRITREDGSEPDYNVQRLEVGLTRMLIIFNEPLEPGQKITIEPL